MNLVENLLTLVGARITLIGIESADESRVRASIHRAADLHGREGGGEPGAAWCWSCVGAYLSDLADGSTPRLGLPGWEQPRADEHGEIRWSEACPWRNAITPDGQRAEGDVVSALLAGAEWARQHPEQSGLIVILDAHPFLQGPAFRRILRDCAELLRSTQVSIVLTSPDFAAGDGHGIPADLAADLHLVRPGLPDREELLAYVEAAMESYSDDVPRLCTVGDVADACRGGTSIQVQDWIAQSVAQTGAIDCDVIASYKATALSSCAGITYEDCADGIEHVGGLDALKAWLVGKRRGLSERARALGMLLQGIVLIGPPGTGKSLVSRVVASIFRVPLLSLSLGEVMDKWQGGSEANIRRALDTAEALAPCVLRIDEIDKAMGGGGDADGGTSKRVLGMILTWLEERKAPVFVVATANDVSAMRPELLRSGRWDGSWLVDLPHVGEREEILRVHLARRGLDLAPDAVTRLAARCDRYSGSEIEQAIREARWICDPDLEGLGITEEGVAAAIDQVIPLSRSMGEQIDAIQAWCRSRAQPASTPPVAATTAQPVGRAVKRR
jgi:hypothetical protein